jgi:4-hydroxy-3-polyprenylbenzoate decarboxylase
MAFKDNREFIMALEKTGDLVRIKQEVDWDLEVGAIVRRTNELRGPAVFFERIKDYPEGYRIFGSPLATYRRLAIAMGLDPNISIRELHEEYGSIVPCGEDELGFAGALQGSPVEIVKAKTVDAYAIASSEWVIEGYWMPDRIWETDEAEKIGKSDVATFFPEWSGYMGRARKVFKFQVTAITHRKESPIFFAPLAHGFEADNMVAPFREASFYEMAQRILPGFVVDVNIPFALKRGGGIVFQVRKRRPMDEGFQRNILLSALAESPGLAWAIAVDDDVDIYNSDELLWAITTRANPKTDFFSGPEGSVGGGMTPSEIEKGIFHGGTCIDATVSFFQKDKFERAHYPVDKIDLRKWFSEEEIKSVRAIQCEYAKVLAKRGW